MCKVAVHPFLSSCSLHVSPLSPTQYSPRIPGRGGKDRKEGHQKPEDCCSEVICASRRTTPGFVEVACCIWLFIVFPLRFMTPTASHVMASNPRKPLCFVRDTVQTVNDALTPKSAFISDLFSITHRIDGQTRSTITDIRGRLTPD